MVMDTGRVPTPRLSRAEIRKDTLQSAVVVLADTVGEVTGILANAVKDVAGSVGNLATELFELRDSARLAAGDVVQEPGLPDSPPAPPSGPEDA